MLIQNVKIVNFDSIINNANIEINGSIITKITPMPGEAKMIVVPGFIDSHIHGFMGHDNMDSKQAVEIIAKNLKEVGTTSFLPTVMTREFDIVKRALNDVSTASSQGARILGSHLEGPFISLEKKGAHDPEYLLKPTIELLDEVIKASNNTLKKITIAPEMFSDQLIKYLADQNIIVSIGHTNGDASDVKRAVKEGATSCTHLWNAMTGVANRQPGIVEGILINGDVYAEMVFDLIHVDQDTIDLTVKAKGASKIVAVTDALMVAGLPDGDSVSGGLDVTKKGLKIVLKGTDTIAGAGITLHDSFKILLELGYDIKDVVAFTSYNAAQNLGVDLGQVKEGKQADLVIMDKNYNIEKVLVKGE